MNHVLPKLLDFVYEAKNLTDLILDLDFQEHSQYFYDNLVSIRRSQAANFVLRVKLIRSSSFNVLESPDGEKYVKLLFVDV